ncbi:MATE family efflux transporter [Nocardioides terrisoli]|uniref:MATE family efflux transporter n=1 Tax=Nocardioides terrisoli TaxID=3388267 RepID=UPI00287BA5B5|nr:MATE family efflux transporter [Nocardioides marmorisolisilvae]
MPDRWGREIWHLSVAAFFALVTEPLFLLADTAIVGHLGTAQLAGLGIAVAILGVIQSLCIFLAYGTTSAVAREIGAGRTSRALAQGVDGVWLAVGVGLLITLVTEPLVPRIVGLFGPTPEVAGYAVTYLHVSLLGVVAMLVMLAAVGVLRGVKDLRTPLVVAVTANLANIALNLLLVYGVGGWNGLGIAGSALGSLIAQVAAATVLLVVLLRGVRRAGAPLAPDLTGIRRAGTAGVPLIVRTLALRAALLLMTWGATRFGSVDLAAMQLALTIWSFLAFVLDAIGISAQTMVGTELGARRWTATRRLTGALVRWGLALGVLTGLVLLACATVLGRLFTDDPRVLHALAPALLVAAIAQPVAGLVFVLDGVLIGAGDNRYLAAAQVVVLAVFAPVALWVVLGGHGLTWLWVAFAVAFMGGRAVVLGLRARGQAWLGAPRSAAGGSTLTG